LRPLHPHLYVAICYLYFTRSKVDGFTTVKANKGRTPAVSSHPSRPEFESKKEMIKAMLLRRDSQPPQDHSAAKAMVWYS